jgi:hypothetical protein
MVNRITYYICLSISTFLSVLLSAFISVFLPVLPSVFPLLFPSVYQLVFLSVFLSVLTLFFPLVFPSVFLSVMTSDFLSVFAPVLPSVSPRIIPHVFPIYLSVWNWYVCIPLFDFGHSSPLPRGNHDNLRHEHFPGQDRRILIDPIDAVNESELKLRIALLVKDGRHGDLLRQHCFGDPS